MSVALPQDAASHVMHWGGESVHLLPERALWWPARRVLFIADLHLGKAATYRSLGQPVPSGTTQDNLQRLDALIGALAPAQLVFLGDLLHGPVARQPATMDAAHAWRQRHAHVEMTLVRGNHDARAGSLPSTLAMTTVAEPYLIGAFACCHEPQAHPTHFVLAGHVHPVMRLTGGGRERLRLPCFVEDRGCAILPAFGAFTGGFVVDPAPGRRLYAVGDRAVWPLPACRA